VNSNVFEKINDAAISSEKLSVRCLVACKRKNLNQVTVFDILEIDEEIDKLRVAPPTLASFVPSRQDIPTYKQIVSKIGNERIYKKNNSIQAINFQHESTQHLKLGISYDLE